MVPKIIEIEVSTKKVMNKLITFEKANLSAAELPTATHPLRSLSIVVPAYNEESRLTATLDKLKEFVFHQGYPFAEHKR